MRAGASSTASDRVSPSIPVFAAGLHDDQVDALANIGRILDKMSDGQVPKAEPPPRWPITGVPDPHQPGRVRIRIDMEPLDRHLNLSHHAHAPDLSGGLRSVVAPD